MKKGILEVDALHAILAQNKTMSQQISIHLSEMQVSAVSAQNAPQKTPYDMNGGFTQGENYEYAEFYPEQVNFMGNAPRNPNNDPYAKNFNQGWRDHLNFGWREQHQRPHNFNNSQSSFNQNNFNNRQFQSSEPQQPQQATSQPQKTTDLESLVASFS
ncbi:hypothetical protein AHAS_Ahas14G0163300 [Arachis hypogaea]